MENYKIVSVNEWNDRHDDYVYHYTDFKSAINILQHNVLFASQARITRFGRGVFMTKYSPNKSDYDLIQNNYQGNWKHASKVDCAFAFKSAYLGANKFREQRDFNRDLWKHDADIFLSTIEFTLILRKEQHFYLITVEKSEPERSIEPIYATTVWRQCEEIGKPEPKKTFEPIYSPIVSPQSVNKEILSQAEKSVETLKKICFPYCLII